MRMIWRGIVDWWRDYTSGLTFFPVFALLLVTVLIIFAEQYGQPGYYKHHLNWIGREAGDWHGLSRHLYWFGSSFFFYAVLPLGMLLVFRRRFRDFGLGLGDWRKGLKILALFVGVMLPVIVVILQTEAFRAHYPLNKAALNSLTLFLVYEAAYIAYFFAWEFVYRGFLLFALYPTLKNWAILIQMVPFALLHIGKPLPETLASVAAGLILGALALRTRSMLYGWILHAVSAVALDIGVFVMQGRVSF